MGKITEENNKIGQQAPEDQESENEIGRNVEEVGEEEFDLEKLTEHEK